MSEARWRIAALIGISKIERIAARECVLFLDHEKDETRGLLTSSIKWTAIRHYPGDTRKAEESDRPRLRETRATDNV